MKRDNYVILLDWPKGAWKSSVSVILNDIISWSVILSLDVIRRNIPYSMATTRYNQMAYELLLEQMKKEIRLWKHIIIDCGMIEEKLIMLQEAVSETGVLLYKYYLEGPYEVLFARVKNRDIQEWKKNKWRTL